MANIMSCRTIPQKNMEPIQLVSVSVYLDFNKKGYTTAGASTHFNDLEKAKTKKTLVSKYDCERLEKIINRAERRKHFQTKFGTTNFFSEMTFAEQNFVHKVVISGVGTSYNLLGKSKGEYAFITNLTSLEDYFITDQSDLKWLSEFFDYLKSQ